MEHTLAAVDAVNLSKSSLVEMLTNQASSTAKIEDLGFLFVKLVTVSHIVYHLSALLRIRVTNNFHDGVVVGSELVVDRLHLIGVVLGVLVHLHLVLGLEPFEFWELELLTLGGFKFILHFVWLVRF